jgi:predicted ArsR family transcriptional regulator
VVAGPRSGGKPARVFVLTESAVKQFAHSIAELTMQAHEQAQFR